MYSHHHNVLYKLSYTSRYLHVNTKSVRRGPRFWPWKVLCSLKFFATVRVECGKLKRHTAGVEVQSWSSYHLMMISLFISSFEVICSEISRNVSFICINLLNGLQRKSFFRYLLATPEVQKHKMKPMGSEIEEMTSIKLWWLWIASADQTWQRDIFCFLSHHCP